MKIFVTGAAGFIGSALIRYIIDYTDWEVFGIDNLSNMYNDPLKNVKLCGLNENPVYLKEYPLYNGRYIFAKCDICDFNGLMQMMHDAEPDIVIHLVKYRDHVAPPILGTNNKTWKNSTGRSLVVDIEGFNNVLNIMSTYRLGNRFLYITDTSLYDNCPYPPNESMRCNVSADYNKVISMANEIQSIMYSKLTNMSIISQCMIVNDVYGPNMNSASTLYKMFETLIYDEKSVSLRVNNIYDKYDFTYIDNLVQYIMVLIYKEESSVISYYNINDRNEVVHLSNVIQKISGRYDHEVRYNVMPLFGDTVNNHIDSSLFFNTFKDVKTIPFQDGFEKTCQWLEESEFVNIRDHAQEYIDYLMTDFIRIPNEASPNIDYLNKYGNEVNVYHFQGMRALDLCNKSSIYKENIELSKPDNLTILTTYTEESKVSFANQLKKNNIDFMNSYKQEFGEFHRTKKISYIIDRIHIDS